MLTIQEVKTADQIISKLCHDVWVAAEGFPDLEDWKVIGCVIAGFTETEIEFSLDVDNSDSESVEWIAFRVPYPMPEGVEELRKSMKFVDCYIGSWDWEDAPEWTRDSDWYRELWRPK